MIHYHGTPITPRAVLYELAGKHFCISHTKPGDVGVCHQIGQSVMLDNGAFSAWRGGNPVDWRGYYEWSDRWLSAPTTWAVIPDVIDASEAQQETLIQAWPHGAAGAPVWHLNESIDRLLRLCDAWPRVCFGSAGRYAVVGNALWCHRVDEAWNAIASRHRRLPWIHMLRGMALSGQQYPFASADSTDVARNHHRPQNGARRMADRWDAQQTPSTWAVRAMQTEAFA